MEDKLDVLIKKYDISMDYTIDRIDQALHNQENKFNCHIHNIETDMDNTFNRMNHKLNEIDKLLDIYQNVIFFELIAIFVMMILIFK